MKKLAILMLLALEVAVCGCGTSPNTNPTTSTAATGILGSPTYWRHGRGQQAEFRNPILRDQHWAR